ncbi:MAG TPA: mechanosensitive ion channel family protein [Phycisphaerae bacterium]|nr:mechanosensitive ion channel family protein [Phycisphaerae bacterium]
MFERIGEFIERDLGAQSPYRGLVLAVLTCLALWLGYWLTGKALKRYLRRKAQKPENVQNFLLLWRYLWLGAAVILVIISLSGSIAALGISAAFLGMILGWSLQAPVTGIAAWLMIILKRPFKIGDRIIVSGIVGDVVDINLTHIVMNQVGGTVGGEEKSGRGVMIPNATLFQQIIFNYSFETKFILDEVPVLITYESGYDEAERILIAAAREVTADIVAETGQEPFVRAELADSGIRMRLRYQTLGTERQRISGEIVKRIIQEFNKTDAVEFAYPHTEVLHRPKPERRGR